MAFFHEYLKISLWIIPVILLALWLLPKLSQKYSAKLSYFVWLVTLTISNAGEESLDKEYIFDRFYQGSRKEGSTGLGLALVAAVCRYYNLRIEYKFAEGLHLFEVEF